MRERQLIWDGFLLAAFLALVLAVNMCPANAKAAPVCEGEDCAVHLDKGDIAPFEGMLISPRLAIDQATKARDAEDWSKIEVERATGPIKADLLLEKKLRFNDTQHFNLERGLLQKRLQEAHTSATRSWYEHPALWYTLGFLTGVAATSAAVYVGVRVLDASK